MATRRRKRRQPARRAVSRSVLARALDAARGFDGVSWWWERLNIDTAQITCVDCGLRRRHFLPGNSCRGVRIRRKAAVFPTPERVDYATCPLIKTSRACGQNRAIRVAIGELDE